MSDALTLRAACIDDAARLFAWVNDPVARSVSFHTEPIPWETHLAWLNAALASTKRRLYIAELGGEPIGTARLDRDEGEPRVAIVSLTISAGARGRGLGRALLEALAVEAQRLGYTRLRALVKPSNEASARAFLATGYVRVEDVVLGGVAAQRYERTL